MPRPTPKLLSIAGAAIFLFGISLNIAWLLLASYAHSHFSNFEFPLTRPMTVAIDPTGQIYVGDCFSGRIQRYSPTGQFQTGWPVAAGGGLFALRATTPDQIEAATARDNNILTFNSTGQLLNSTHEPQAFTQFRTTLQPSAPYIVTGRLIPKIVDRQTGKTIIATPWPKRIFAIPFPSAAYSILGLTLFALGQWLTRKNRALQPAANSMGR
jgi:hypothetical protein